MVIKGILLRLSQIVLAALGLYFVLFAGTFLMKGEMAEATRFAYFAGAYWFAWGVVSIIIWRSPVELVREVAIVVYPLGALISLALAVYFGFEIERMIMEMQLRPEREIWSFILGGVLIAIVMIIRCFDIQWLRSIEELKPPVARPDLDEEYGPLQ
jgi:hypothetical protein